MRRVSTAIEVETELEILQYVSRERSHSRECLCSYLKRFHLHGYDQLIQRSNVLFLPTCSANMAITPRDSLSRQEQWASSADATIILLCHGRDAMTGTFFHLWHVTRGT
jgi:hypothetical protein